MRRSRAIGYLATIGWFGIIACGVQAHEQTTPFGMAATPQEAAIGYAEYFSKDNQHPEQIVIDSVNGASQEIVTAMYSFTYQPIWDAYEHAARDRHIPITLVVDRTELHGASNRAMRAGVNALCGMGIDVREDTFSGLMHLKLSAIDGRHGLGGSFNYTTAATRSNDEILTVVDSPKYAAQYRAHIVETYGVSKSACGDVGTVVPVPSPGARSEGAENGD
jgi:phosphatidylserine/phosphatidylglycerophosphate/cardiolipin synthase-like enzyme